MMGGPYNYSPNEIKSVIMISWYIYTYWGKVHVANVIATFKMIQKPPKLQQKLDSFVQQRET